MEYAGETGRRRSFVMKARYYPPGGPKIVREEIERLGFDWKPPFTPFGMYSSWLVGYLVM